MFVLLNLCCLTAALSAVVCSTDQQGLELCDIKVGYHSNFHQDFDLSCEWGSVRSMVSCFCPYQSPGDLNCYPAGEAANRTQDRRWAILCGGVPVNPDPYHFVCSLSEDEESCMCGTGQVITALSSDWVSTGYVMKASSSDWLSAEWIRKYKLTCADMVNRTTYNCDWTNWLNAPEEEVRFTLPVYPLDHYVLSGLRQRYSVAQHDSSFRLYVCETCTPGVLGEWEKWGSCGRCDVTSGLGSRKRRRSCDISTDDSQCRCQQPLTEHQSCTCSEVEGMQSILVPEARNKG